MNRFALLFAVAVLVGCAGEPAHRDCDRTLVPINVTSAADDSVVAGDSEDSEE